ncbi:SNARE domain protein, partial [Cooperia oncophora]
VCFRARRRREREGTLAGVSHEEGLSSDDDEPTSQQLADQQAAAEIDTALNMVFVDALDDYSHLRKVLDRMIDWFAVDQIAFQDAYIVLCIPKLASPYVRIQLITADILKRDDFILSSMPWYVDCIRAIQENGDVDPKHEVLTGLIPSIIEKVVLPYLTDVVNVEWEPMSLKQSKRLGAVLSGLSDYPKMNVDESKSFAILGGSREGRKSASAIDTILYRTIYSKQSIKNPATGCAAFLDRQYWAAIKVSTSFENLSEDYDRSRHFLKSKPRGRQTCVRWRYPNRVWGSFRNRTFSDDHHCHVKALIAEIPDDMIESAKSDSFRNLIRCLGRGLLEEQKAAGRGRAERYLEKLQKQATKIDQIDQQLQSSLSQLLSERGNLIPAEQEHFDERTEQIRKQIQTAIRVTQSLPPLTSKNPFLEEDSDETNPYEAESKRYLQESSARVLEMKAKAEEARMTAEATAKLNKDMRDLEDIFAELATIVHEQHEIVDSIEEHVERATHDVRHGNEQLKKAIRHKTNQV